MDIDPNGKRDSALLGVLKTILLFLESLQLRSTCNILQAECAQMGYPELNRSQPHILLLRPSETFNSIPITTTNNNNNNHTSSAGKGVQYRRKTVVDQGAVKHPPAPADDLIYGPESNAGDMPYVHHTHHDVKGRGQRNDGGKKRGMAINGNEGEMKVNEMLSQAESVMKELRLRGKPGEELESISVFFADTQQDPPNLSQQHRNPPRQQDNYSARPLCSCCSCREYAAAALDVSANECTSAEHNLRTALSTGTSGGGTINTNGGTCKTTSGNHYNYCTPPLENVRSNVSSGYPPPARRNTCPTICTSNLSVGKVSEEHIKLLAIASNLTHALQSQVRGQSNRIDELLATCRRLCPEFFAPCKSACASQPETQKCEPPFVYCNPTVTTCQLLIEDVPNVNDDDRGLEDGQMSMQSGDRKSGDSVVLLDAHDKLENIDKAKTLGHKNSDCFIKAMDIRNQNKKPSESSFNSSDNYGTELDFKKIKRHLITKSTGRKLALLQALRWRLTKSDVDYRDHTLNSYIRNDLLGLNTTDATAYMTKFLGDNVSEKPEVMQETMARLVNAFASLTLGRDYLSFDDNVVMDLFIPLLLGQHPSGVTVNQKTREFLIATLQKLSLRAKIRKIMVSKGIVQYILDYLSENLKEMNSYCLEYATALLMNLCLHPEAQQMCSSRPTQVVQLMKDLLKSEYQCCLLYANGIMYSLLKNQNINEEAHNMNLEDDINAAMQHYSDPELKRQFAVILALHLQGADPELEHACANAEPDEELDILEPELDMDDSIDGSDDILNKYRIKLDGQTGNIILTTLCNPTTPRSARSAFRPNSADSSRSGNTRTTQEEREKLINESDENINIPDKTSTLSYVDSSGSNFSNTSPMQQADPVDPAAKMYENLEGSEYPLPQVQQTKQTSNIRSDTIEKRYNENVPSPAPDQQANEQEDNTSLEIGEVREQSQSRTRSSATNQLPQATHLSESTVLPKNQGSRKSINSSNTSPSTITTKLSSGSDWSRSTNNESNTSKTRDTVSEHLEKIDQRSNDKQRSTATTSSNVVKDIMKIVVADATAKDPVRSVSAPPSFKATDEGSPKKRVVKLNEQRNRDGMGVIIAVDKGMVYDKIKGPSKYSKRDSVCVEMGRATDAQLAMIRTALRHGSTLEEAMGHADITSIRSGISSVASVMTVCCGHELMPAENVCYQDCIAIKEQRKANLPETGCADPIYSDHTPKDDASTSREMPKFKQNSSGPKPRKDSEDSDKHGGFNYGVNYPDPLDKCRKTQLANCERKCEVARKRFCARANQQCLVNAPERPSWCCSIRPPTSPSAQIPAATRPVPPLLQGCCTPDGRELAYATRCATEALKNYTCDCYQEIRNFLSYHNTCSFLPNENRSNSGITNGLYGLKRCCRDRSQ